MKGKIVREDESMNNEKRCWVEAQPESPKPASQNEIFPFIPEQLYMQCETDE